MAEEMVSGEGFRFLGHWDQFGGGGTCTNWTGYTWTGLGLMSKRECLLEWLERVETNMPGVWEPM